MRRGNNELHPPRTDKSITAIIIINNMKETRTNPCAGVSLIRSIIDSSTLPFYTIFSAPSALLKNTGRMIRSFKKNHRRKMEFTLSADVIECDDIRITNQKTTFYSNRIGRKWSPESGMSDRVWRLLRLSRNFWTARNISLSEPSNEIVRVDADRKRGEALLQQIGGRRNHYVFTDRPTPHRAVRATKGNPWNNRWIYLLYYYDYY